MGIDIVYNLFLFYTTIMEKFIGFAVIIGMIAIIIAAAGSAPFLEPRENPPGTGFFSLPDSAYTSIPPLRPSTDARGYAGQAAPPQTSSQPSVQESFEERLSRIRATLALQKAQTYQTDPQKEYVDAAYRSSFVSEDSLPIDMSGWTIENKRGDHFALGYAANLPYAREPATLAHLIVLPASTIHIVTGQSPIGSNFRVNKCTGYFAQFNDVTPSLAQKCPRPSDEPAQTNLNDICLDYIESLPHCRIPQNTLLDIGNTCRAYITANISYSGCVANHKIDPDFYENEWYVYLARSTELWKNKRETISLRDQQGNLMAELEY